MKAVQVMFDESLLRRLEEDREVRRIGRSAVVRRAVARYLRDAERESIERQYNEAYGNGSGIGEELDEWSEEGAWPRE
ncbi:MAG: ribbon-helix-helix protein, CopG family [Spirochaetota bacterium]